MSEAGPAPRVAICAAGEIWGGVEQFVCYDAARLHAAGMLAVVVVFHEARLHERLRRAGLPVAVVHSRSRLDPGAVAEVKRLLRVHRVDLLHVHGYKAAILAGIAARLAGVRVVRTEHGRLEPGSGWKMRANVFADRVLAPLVVDGVAFVSRDVWRATRLAYPFARSRLIHNGVPGDARRPEPVPEIDPTRFNIGIVGRVSVVKGHTYLLTAMSLLDHLDDLVLHVIGDGPELPACVAQAEALGQSSRVRFLGFRDHPLDYFRRLDLLVMPSLREGLPYTLLEAMRAGVPIVASAVGGLQEVLLHRHDGYLVPPRSPSALAAAIEELYHDAGLRRRLAANASSKVAREYSLERQAQSYTSLYRDVLGSAL